MHGAISPLIPLLILTGFIMGMALLICKTPSLRGKIPDQPEIEGDIPENGEPQIIRTLQEGGERRALWDDFTSR